MNIGRNGRVYDYVITDHMVTILPPINRRKTIGIRELFRAFTRGTIYSFTALAIKYGPETKKC